MFQLLSPKLEAGGARLRRTLAALAILLVLTAGFYWKLTLTREWTFLEGPDLAIQVRPWLDFAAREFHAGRVPLWDPYEWAGHTLIGQVQPGHRESAELDPVRHAAARRPHSNPDAALVLGADSLAGRGLRVSAVPRSGRELRRHRCSAGVSSRSPVSWGTPIGRRF